MFKAFTMELNISFAVKILPILFSQLNLSVKFIRFKKEQGVEKLFESELFKIWRVKFGKGKFSGKVIGSNWRFKNFRRMVLPRSISRVESSNLIGSSNFFSLFNKLQFTIGAGTSGNKMKKVVRLFGVAITISKMWLINNVEKAQTRIV